jgi:TctA family transporter
MAFSLIGVYTVAGNPFHIYEIAAFGLLGYIMVKLGCEPAPFLLGFILGPMLEEHFVRAMLISRGDLGIFVMHPLSAGLLGLAAVLLVFVSKPSVSKKREQVFVEET